MKEKQVAILVIDDSPDDQALIEMAFRMEGVTCPINIANSGNEAIAYLKGEGKFSDRSQFPYPTLILTDLKMHDGDGFAVLEYMHCTREEVIIPTIVFSGSADLDDIRRSYELCANSYIMKHCDFTEMRRVLKLAYDYWMECATPELDVEGRMLETQSKGKLGERFLNQKSKARRRAAPRTRARV